MNTSEQRKAEVIKAAWVAEIGEENFKRFPEYDTDYFHPEGWVHSNYLPKVYITIEMEISEIQIVHKRKSLFVRPKSLYGIENNNGWISLEADGSNLPESGEYWVVDTLNGIRSYLYHAKDGGDIIFWKNQVTHFQEITKPQPPIF